MKILIVDDEVAGRKNVEAVILKILPDADITLAENADEVLLLCDRVRYDVIFMDIQMPGMDGLSLTRELQKMQPGINIIIVTAYDNYALDALRLYVSGYVMKPPLEKDIRDALSNLRYPLTAPEEKTRGLYVQCYGNFEVFFDGSPIRFRRKKSKEMLAYLIDRRGAAVTNAELRAVLWEDDGSDMDKQRNYLTQICTDLRQTLKSLGCSDILVQSRNSYSIIPDKIHCDYYASLKDKSGIADSFAGEYMSQYSWAEMSTGLLF